MMPWDLFADICQFVLNVAFAVLIWRLGVRVWRLERERDR